MTWQKNDWNKVIDEIVDQTKTAMQSKDDILIVSAETSLFSDLLKYSGTNFHVEFYSSLAYEEDIFNDGKTLFVNEISRNNYKFIRNISRMDYFRCNFYPFIGLFDSELMQIANLIKSEFYRNLDKKKWWGNSINCSSMDLEWANLEDEKFGIISGIQDPTKNQRWNGYSLQQKELISQLWQIEKQTQDKFKQPTMLHLTV